MIDSGQIRAAADTIRGDVHRTPLFSSRSLGAMTGTELHLKAECLQKTGSFKVRGVFNRLRALDAAERERGVVTVSAGNHAQALAYGAAAARVPATVVMPATASPSKVEASRAYGARVVLHGDVFGAFEHMEELRQRDGLVLIHPFDDEAVIAGQGTVGLEILEDVPEPDAVVVPVGGGGLISGIATAVKALSPRTRMIGVEPAGAANVTAALEAGRVVRLERVETIADGLAPPMTGPHVLEHVRAFVDDVVTVSDQQIVDALRLILARAKLLVEPAGAAAVAALLAGVISLRPGSRVVAVVSGGNIGLPRLAELLV